MSFALALLLVVGAQHSQSASPSVSSPHDMHTTLNERGEKGMGFSQTATAHHFLLTNTGGIILVEASDSSDATSRDNIRMHLHHIARAFQTGDFDIPMFVHDTMPPGVTVMKERIKLIHYLLQDTPNGGRVIIQTRDKAALDAIHSFLQFQITEHRTGDPLDIP
jgi:hypothetical protein